LSLGIFSEELANGVDDGLVTREHFLEIGFLAVRLLGVPSRGLRRSRCSRSGSDLLCPLLCGLTLLAARSGLGVGFGQFFRERDGDHEGIGAADVRLLRERVEGLEVAGQRLPGLQAEPVEVHRDLVMHLADVG